MGTKVTNVVKNNMSKKINWFFGFFVVFMCSLLISGCSKEKGDSTIGDIAYDVNKKWGYTVYIEENSEYVPYLVLTDQYNDKVLLLRENLLDEVVRFNDYSGYYEDSHIDQYLNNTFMEVLTSEMQGAIVDSEIAITAESSLGVVGTDTTNIERKIFLLSYSELGLIKTDLASFGGESLKYFKNGRNNISFYIAYRRGIATSWLLRTSYTWYEMTAWGIGPDGIAGHASACNKNGIRPAFCVKKELEIIKSEEVIDGEIVYIFKGQ